MHALQLLNQKDDNYKKTIFLLQFLLDVLKHYHINKDVFWIFNDEF